MLTTALDFNRRADELQSVVEHLRNIGQFAERAAMRAWDHQQRASKADIDRVKRDLEYLAQLVAASRDDLRSEARRLSKLNEQAGRSASVPLP